MFMTCRHERDFAEDSFLIASPMFGKKEVRRRTCSRLTELNCTPVDMRIFVSSLPIPHARRRL